MRGFRLLGVRFPPRRMSRRPSKQLLWFMVEKEMSKPRPPANWLDVGAAALDNFWLFPAGRYFGLDIDAERLERGGRMHPEAYTVHWDLLSGSAPFRGDLVVCTQVIGFNNLFVHDSAKEAIVALVDAVGRGGDLIVNVGPEAELDVAATTDLLRREFVRVKVIRYGRLSSEVSPLASLLIATILLAVPVARGSGSALFVAAGRK